MGNVYSWGQGLYGQLGQGLELDETSTPLVLAKLNGKDIIQVRLISIINGLGCLWTASFIVFIKEWNCLRLW